MRRWRSSVVAALGLSTVTGVATRARADENLGDVASARSDEVSFDARHRELVLRGNVHLDAPPFHVTSDELSVRRTSHGLEIDGHGRLAFCPCAGTPLAVTFEGATVAPPGDLLLDRPRLEAFGLPIFALPFFWLRSTARPGILPPLVQYRGGDGLLLGGGVHLPWNSAPRPHELWPKPETPPDRMLDLRAGGYLKGGAMTEAVLTTPQSHTRARFDALDGAGLLLDARGAVDDGIATLGWDVDGLRGTRAVRMTTELEAASRKYDRLALEGSIHGHGLSVGSGFVTVARRGADAFDLGAAGPVLRVYGATNMGGVLVVDASADGGVLRGTSTLPTRDGSDASFSFGRLETGARAAARFDYARATASARSVTVASSDGDQSGAASSALGRVAIDVPLERGYGEDGRWLHRIEPGLAGTVRGEGVNGPLPPLARGDGYSPGQVPAASPFAPALAWAGEVTLAQSVGRWERHTGVETLLASGFVGRVGQDVLPAVRARVSSDLTLLGASIDGAALGPASASPSADARGASGAARVRVGPRDGLHLSSYFEVREGVEPALARLLGDASLEPGVGAFSRQGASLGGALSVPWSAYLSTWAGVDGDASAASLLGVRGGALVRDRCGCIALRAGVSRRLGRDGVDVLVSLDFADRR